MAVNIPALNIGPTEGDIIFFVYIQMEPFLLMLATAAAVFVCSRIFLQLLAEKRMIHLKIHSRSGEVSVFDSVCFFVLYFRGMVNKESPR
jgi:hypothetical protein